MVDGISYNIYYFIIDSDKKIAEHKNWYMTVKIID